MIVPQAIKFLFYGGVASIVHILSRFVLSFFVSYRIAIVLAFFVGMATGFVLFKTLVFESKSSQKTFREVVWYIFVNMLALVQTYLISIGLSEHVFPWARMNVRPYDVAHIIGVLVPVITSYFGHKYLTFAGKNLK